MVVLIDNDELIHKFWSIEAQKSNIELMCFKSVDEFISNSSNIDKDSEIYIDCELENGLRGEIESEKVSLIGFDNLYLATGHSKSDIKKPIWIKSICGKRPPF